MGTGGWKGHHADSAIRSLGSLPWGVRSSPAGGWEGQGGRAASPHSWVKWIKGPRVKVHPSSIHTATSSGLEGNPSGLTCTLQSRDLRDCSQGLATSRRESLGVNGWDQPWGTHPETHVASDGSASPHGVFSSGSVSFRWAVGMPLLACRTRHLPAVSPMWAQTPPHPSSAAVHSLEDFHPQFPVPPAPCLSSTHQVIDKTFDRVTSGGQGREERLVAIPAARLCILEALETCGFSPGAATRNKEQCHPAVWH